MNYLKDAFFSALAVLALSRAPSCLAGEIVWWTPNWGEARAKKLAESFQAANPRHHRKNTNYHL